MQQLFSIFVFYRPLILWSFTINTLLSFLKYSIIPVAIIKLFLVAFLWYLLNETNARRKLILYKNLGISTLKLFAFSYIMDLVFSVPFLLVLKVFV